MNQEVFTAAAEALERGEPVALVTIVSTRGSTPQRVGAKMLVFADGRMIGTIGGGCYENDAPGKARGGIAGGKPKPVQYDLNDDFLQDTARIGGAPMEAPHHAVEPAHRARG